jgi:hypothetical protein
MYASIAVEKTETDGSSPNFSTVTWARYPLEWQPSEVVFQRVQKMKFSPPRKARGEAVSTLRGIAVPSGT